MTLRQALVDKLKGAPSRPVQAANYVEKHAKRGDPRNVLATIDRFAREERWLMNVGPDKGPLMQELAERLPENANILELGAYCGYSSIMLATIFGPKSRIISV
jgi:catechol O-methyltransferase